MEYYAEKKYYELIKHYSEKYPNLDVDILCDIIEETLDTAPIDFTYEFIQERDYCNRCGGCCKLMKNIKGEDGCEYLQKDPDNRGKYICEIWNNRPYECKAWPYLDYVNGRGIHIVSGCNYIDKLIYEVLDKKLQLYVDD